MKRVDPSVELPYLGDQTLDSPENLTDLLHHMVQQRDPYTAVHMSHVEWLAVRIAEKTGLDEYSVVGLRLGARLHDLGKFSIPFEVLNKTGRLTPHELTLLREHSQRGYDLTNRMKWPWPVPEMLLQHHERIDGSGYPLGIRGQDILPEAKIIGVADVVESMLSHRPYRPGLQRNIVAQTLRDGRSTLFEPNVVDACFDLFDELIDHLSAQKPDLSQTLDRS